MPELQTRIEKMFSAEKMSREQVDVFCRMAGFAGTLPAPDAGDCWTPDTIRRWASTEAIRHRTVGPLVYRGI